MREVKVIGDHAIHGATLPDGDSWVAVLYGVLTRGRTRRASPWLSRRCPIHHFILFVRASLWVASHICALEGGRQIAPGLVIDGRQILLSMPYLPSVSVPVFEDLLFIVRSQGQGTLLSCTGHSACH